MILSLLAGSPLETGPTPFDVSEIKGNFAVVTDNKGHYLVYTAKEPIGKPLFYGDGKVFYRLRSPGGGGSSERWDISLWDPRTSSEEGGNYVNFSMRDDGEKYHVQCGKKTTPLTPLTADDAKKLVDAAEFKGPLWTRLPERLLRDSDGTYYFVDRLRSDDSDRRDFVFYKGPRGKMKVMKLKDIVDDTEGTILATKDGQLRLVANNQERKWVAGKKNVALTEVPLDDIRNAKLVYTELGVYDGKRLGTPCDDLM